MIKINWDNYFQEYVWRHIVPHCWPLRELVWFGWYWVNYDADPKKPGRNKWRRLQSTKSKWKLVSRAKWLIR